jgi:hypothetical protein
MDIIDDLTTIKLREYIWEIASQFKVLSIHRAVPDIYKIYARGKVFIVRPALPQALSPGTGGLIRCSSSDSSKNNAGYYITVEDLKLRIPLGDLP